VGVVVLDPVVDEGQIEFAFQVTVEVVWGTSWSSETTIGRSRSRAFDGPSMGRRSTGEEYSQPDTPSLNLRLFNTLGRFRVPDDSPSLSGKRCEGNFR
jgi:hypothetical protein